MDQDERCCGTGTCIINADGQCWCGQQWNGTAMCFPDAPAAATPAPRPPEAGAEPAAAPP